MSDFSQNGEQIEILKYFNRCVGCFADFGSNDGVKYSNTYALAQSGWHGLLVEPAPMAFKVLVNNYSTNEKCILVNAALGETNGEATFYDSGVEEIHGGAMSLVATMSLPDKQKWEKAVDYTEIKVPVITFEKLLKDSPYKTFDFISLDAEGYDWIILQQMNLSELKCKCLCIEHNGDQILLQKIIEYCSQYGLTKELLRNAENIILALP